MKQGTLAAKLKRYMFEHDLTQRQMAAALGVSSFTIWKVLADYGYTPGERLLFKIDRLLHGDPPRPEARP